MSALLTCTLLVQTHGYASRVQFRLACTKIPKDVLLLEIGPHALMRSPLRQNRSDLQYVATMKKGESAVDTLAAAVADLWRKGAIFSWPASAAPSAGVHPEREAQDTPFLAELVMTLRPTACTVPCHGPAFQHSWGLGAGMLCTAHVSDTIGDETRRECVSLWT